MFKTRKKSTKNHVDSSYYAILLGEMSDNLFPKAEAVSQRCCIKSLFLEISQSSQEDACARASFLIKLQA